MFKARDGNFFKKIYKNYYDKKFKFLKVLSLGFAKKIKILKFLPLANEYEFMQKSRQFKKVKHASF